jgi:tetratricopeptide (TPR) repeat protein
MDRLDKLSLAVVILLLTGTVILIAGMDRQPKPEHAPGPPAGAAANDPDAAAALGKSAQRIKNLLEADSLVQAEVLIREFVRINPLEAEPYMLMGDLFMRKQDPIRAMHQYKQAIDLNPDYLDKKTPLFQGKKLKVAVGEALSEIDRQLTVHPEDQSLRREKKLVYYLYRRIAGSCG